MQIYKSSKAVKNKTSFVVPSSRLVLSHTDTLHQPVKTGKKAQEMMK